MVGSEFLPDRYLKPAEAAEYLGLAESTIRNKASKGELPFVKIGVALRFRISALDRWIADQNRAA
jgi:excisionase family DNA binding protein